MRRHKIAQRRRERVVAVDGGFHVRRAHAHVEDHIKRLKESGANRFPFTDINANRAWLAVVTFADSLVRWFQQLCLTGTFAVTTQAPLAAAAPSLPANNGFTLPSSFSTSSSTAFNEQLQLTYEIAGYEMMLEGALTDRYTRIQVKDSLQQFVRRRTTIEIPIEIRNPKEYENAVAEVVVTAFTYSPYDEKPAPVVTAILPTEKSYNVAAITDRTASIGGGIVTGVMSAGATPFSPRSASLVARA